MLVMTAPMPVVDVARPHAVLEQLYRNDARRLVGLARLLLRNQARAEEVVQDVFERALRNEGRIGDQPRAYLTRAVVNACRDDARRYQRGLRLATKDRWDVTDVESAERTATRNDAHQRLRDAVDSLPHPQRECVILRYFSQCSVDEIADILRIPAGTVKSHLHRALPLLETLIGAVR